jgi:hypothetical protein
VNDKRVAILEAATQVITKDRQDQYGNAEDCFDDIATLWSWWMGTKFSAYDVAMLNELQKIARTKANPMHMDNYVDGCGYLALPAEMVERPV